MAPVDDGRISSIIFPPPEVRNIVDKTASFVARNGATFENRIKENEVNNPKFNFLTQGMDQYGRSLVCFHRNFLVKQPFV